MNETAGFRWLRRIGLTLLSLFAGVPLLVVALTSITPLADLQRRFEWIPNNPSVRAYRDMWSSIPLARYLQNSAVVSSSVTALTLVVGVPAAYALARRQARDVRLLGLTLLATQAAPGLMFLLPLVLLYAKISDVTGIELVGTYPGLILTDLTFALPATIWIISVYIASLPADVEDAARLDGAGSLRVLLCIVLPRAVPGLVAASLFSFLSAWGEVLFATVLTDSDTETVPVGLHGFATQATVYWNQVTAAALTTSLPVIVAFIGLERLFATRLGRGGRSTQEPELPPPRDRVGPRVDLELAIQGPQLNLDRVERDA